MNIDEALDLARKFVLFKLHASSSYIEPISASYDEEDGIWHVSCAFRRSPATSWLRVDMEIDDEGEEVVSFKTSA